MSNAQCNCGSNKSYEVVNLDYLIDKLVARIAKEKQDEERRTNQIIDLYNPRDCLANSIPYIKIARLIIEGIQIRSHIQCDTLVNFHRHKYVYNAGSIDVSATTNIIYVGTCPTDKVIPLSELEKNDNIYECDYLDILSQDEYDKDRESKKRRRQEIMDNMLDDMTDIPFDATVIMLCNYCNRIPQAQFDQLSSTTNDNVHVYVYKLDKKYPLLTKYKPESLRTKYDSIGYICVKPNDNNCLCHKESEILISVVDLSLLSTIASITIKPTIHDKISNIFAQCNENIITCKTLNVRKYIITDTDGNNTTIFNNTNNTNHCHITGSKCTDNTITLFKKSDNIHFIESIDNPIFISHYKRSNYIRKIAKKSVCDLDICPDTLATKLSHLALEQINERIRDSIYRMVRVNQSNDFVITTVDIIEW